MMKKNLGWIGLGHMGTPMVTNLLEENNIVYVYNRTRTKMEEVKKLGAKQVDSPKNVVQQADIIFFMLSNADAIQEVLTQKEGVLEALLQGKIIVDMSTVAPKDSVRFAAMVAEKGGVYLDAPVSGSVGAAISSQLVILTGGDQEAKKICHPYFNILGKKTIDFGENGKGSAAKLSINTLLGVVCQGFAESLLLAEQLGVDKAQMLELISQSPMNNTLFQIKKEMFEKEEFTAAFMIELIAKDMGLAEKEAEKANIQLPLLKEANTTYHSAQTNGKSQLDMAAVYLELKKKNV